MPIKKGKKRALVAMSGGVDSSIAAAILKRRGFDCIGVTFKTWPKEECGSSSSRTCCSLAAITRARAVAEKLKIPYYVFDVYERFKKEVIDYFASEYLSGRTPNPCVVCNEKIKFGFLTEKAKTLGAEFIATGHFAKAGYDKKTKRHILKEGSDKAKDQSYFLSRLSQEQLAKAVFPVGDLTKDKVRRLAKKERLPTHDAVSSQDICFVQDMNYREYLKKTMAFTITSGDIVDSSGKVLGKHRGIPFYTIGQRRGLGIGYREPLYVLSFDVSRNRIVVGTKKDILRKSLIVDGLNWIKIKGLEAPIRAKVKIRYNHKKADALVSRAGETEVRVDFDEPQEAPTPGQAAVFYDRDVVIGGGWIKEVL